MQAIANNPSPPLVIVAGGKGVRMGDLTQHIPKALVKVADKPFLFHQIQYFAKQGVREFIIASGYKHQAMLNYLAQQREWEELKLSEANESYNAYTADNLKISIINTGENNGNAGRIKYIADFLPNIFFMTWCDNISTVNINEMLTFHKKENASMTMLCVNPPERFGVLDLLDNTVTKLYEKTINPERWINAGLFIVDKTVLKHIHTNQSMWEYDVLPNLIKDNKLLAFKYNGYWQCMDNINDRIVMEEDFLNGKWSNSKQNNYANITNWI